MLVLLHWELAFICIQLELCLNVLVFYMQIGQGV